RLMTNDQRLYGQRIRRNGGVAARRWAGLSIDEVLQLFARLEVGHFLRRHIDLVSRLRVAALAGLALAQPEAAEPSQLDLLTAMQRLDDAAEDRVDDDFGVLLRQIRNPRHFLDELRLGHAAVGH